MEELELRVEEKESLLGSSSAKGSRKIYRSNKNSRFSVNEYDKSCEDHAKINKILTLKYSPVKIVFFVV